MKTSTDQRHRFLFDETDIRGEIVSLTQSLVDIFAIQSYPEPIQSLLGEFLVAVSLLSRTLKFDGTLTLQARGDGDLSLIMAEISHQKKIRGVAQLKVSQPNSGARLESSTLGTLLGTLLGKGVLSIIIDPDKGTRYQGIVALEKDTLAGCLEDYFLQSEQIPTKLWLSSNGQAAGGVMLQRLPQQLASAETNNDVWDTQVHLANTLSPEEILELNHETLLTRLFHETGVRLFDPETIAFACSCSKKRSSDALKRLGKEELLTIIEEDGKIEVDCHFCGHNYQYKHDDIESLFAPATQH